MYYVYILQSETNAKKLYTGFTEDLNQRLKDHNSGKSAHTNEHKPWKLITHTVFSDKEKALDFERYLKTGSGRAFLKKHLA